MSYRFARAISRLSSGSRECGINPLEYCPTAKIHCTNRHKTQSISTSDNYWSNNSILQWCYNHRGNHYVNYNGLGMVRSDNPTVEVGYIILHQKMKWLTLLTKQEWYVLEARGMKCVFAPFKKKVIPLHVTGLNSFGWIWHLSHSRDKYVL